MREVPGICFRDFGSGWDLMSCRHSAKLGVDVSAIRRVPYRWEQSDGHNKSQRTRTNVKCKNSATDFRASYFRICSLGRLNKSQFLFNFSGYLCIVSIPIETFGSRVRNGGQAGCVWNSARGEKREPHCHSNRKNEKYEYVSRGRLR